MSACAIASGAGRSTMRTVPRDCATQANPPLRQNLRHALARRADVGALHLRTVSAKDQSCADFPDTGADGRPHPAVVLDLDYWVMIPR